MKKRKPKTPKLSEQKTVAAFLLSIARGADINEKSSGTSLARYYFNTLDCSGNILREFSQATLKKLKILVTLGADTSEIVYYDYDGLILDICKKLTLLTILLESDSAKRELTGARLGLLKGLQQILDETAEVIADTGLVDDMGEVPLPFEQMKELRERLEDITGLESEME